METVALIGSESLLGREIRDIVATSAPGFDLRLIAADEEEPGKLTRVGDEMATVLRLNAVNMADADAIFLAGSPEFNRKALELAQSPVIDLTYVTEDRPEARLRAPFIEEQNEEPADTTGDFHLIAHPAAIALALFLRRLEMHDPIRRSVVQVFAPASELGLTGVGELQQQTVSLLSFKPMPKAVFDTQVAFNLLAQYGEEAPQKLEDLELRIERHLATLLAFPGEGDGVPMPSIRLVQAPVFHGYSFSVWVEFDGNPGVEAIENGLPSPYIDVRTKEFEPPTNVGQAGQSGITVGAITADRNDPESCWFWIVSDNLRLAAENAVAVAKQLL
ncbi:MAG TPA: Asd/ArgC dimerization domain-containing protein [Candidatus Sulfopaludibacter sp.]|jgi:aspartate-semialdehyde dehydrogenase|nr:Asd/ArgC dimerization domain-containing protein [Candidatus Sulfopaludibacter sp.]